MPHLNFDTLKLANKLKDHGQSDTLAKIEAEGISEIATLLQTQLSDHWAHLEARTQLQLNELRLENEKLRGEILRVQEGAKRQLFWGAISVLVIQIILAAIYILNE